MARATHDYMLARKASQNRNRDGNSGAGVNYALRDRALSAETQRAWSEAAAQYVPSLEDKVAAVFDDFRSWCRNREPIALMVELGTDEIPF